MRKKIMVDIETLGVLPGCVVLSIGAIEFNELGCGRSFHQHICPDSACAAGLTIDPRTVMWWLEQSEAARNGLIHAQIVPLETALQELSDAFDWNNVEVWANGASFDFSILKAAYVACGMQPPWQFWNERCFRTLKNLVDKQTYRQLEVLPAVAHDALEDARAQALSAINIFNHIGLSTSRRAA